MLIKRIISVIMLILIISHGIYQLFIFKLFQVKYRTEAYSEIDTGLANEKLVLFSFRVEDYKNNRINVEWIEEDEFRFEKEMYDIVKKEVKGNSIYLFCFHDRKESMLYLVMDKIFKSFEKEIDDLKNLPVYFSQYYSEFPSDYNFYLYSAESYNLTPAYLLEGEYFLITPPPRL